MSIDSQACNAATRLPYLNLLKLVCSADQSENLCVRCRTACLARLLGGHFVKRHDRIVVQIEVRRDAADIRDCKVSAWLVKSNLNQARVRMRSNAL